MGIVGSGFACLAVINGVFMQETFKVAQQDDQIMLRTGPWFSVLRLLHVYS